MATVTTTTTLSAEISNFSAPDILGGEPFSVAEWIGSLTVPLKMAADSSLVSIILTLPLNFVFKIATLHIHYLGDNAADMYDLVDIATPGVIAQGFQSTNQNLVIIAERIPLLAGAPNTFLVTGDNRIVMSKPVGDYQVPIRTGNFAGDNTMAWRWADVTTDDTVEIMIFFRMRALMYTIEQFNQYGMFAAVPTIGV